MGLVHDAGARLAVDGFDAHLAAQAPEALAIDQQTMVAFQHRDQPARSQAGVAQVEFIEQAFDPHVLRSLRHGHVVLAGA